MPISRLVVTHVRNISDARLERVSTINIVFGENGSGKTTLLECVHLLGLGRSFRGSQIKPLVQQGQTSCTVFAQILLDGTTQSAGIRKSLSGQTVCKINGVNQTSLAELANLLPMQLLNADSFLLLSGPPKLRREILDWGVFHVEHEFLLIWRRFQRALKQRNSLLRRGKLRPQDLAPWDNTLGPDAETLDRYRQEYLAAFIPLFKQVLADLTDSTIELSISYGRGWDNSQHYAEYLKANVQRDIERGYTVAGPHRAELRFKAGQQNAADVLSRGQQKLVVAALRLTQGELLAKICGKHSLYLVDDLPAELDKKHRKRLLDRLIKSAHQVFITCIDPQEVLPMLNELPRTEYAMFHVEHGKVSQIEEAK